MLVSSTTLGKLFFKDPQPALLTAGKMSLAVSPKTYNFKMLLSF
jgi:hypothetical protein